MVDAHVNKGIIPRVTGPAGRTFSDIKLLLNHLFLKRDLMVFREITDVVRYIQHKTTTPDQALGRLFVGGSDDRLLKCLLLLVASHNKGVFQLLKDVEDNVFDNTQEALEDLEMLCREVKYCEGVWNEYHKNL